MLLITQSAKASLKHQLNEDMTLGIALLTVSFACVTLFTFLIYRAFFHPLSAIPGPLICRFTNLWLWYHTYRGDECTLINSLHVKYGPVLRIGPNDCVIADGAALAPIYSERGGFLKSECYANFNFEGHQTIFSTRDPVHRAVRSKAVTALFSMNSIRSKHDIFESCARRLVDRIRQEAHDKKRVNMLTLCRRAALDLVCSILFDAPYDSIDERGERLSAASFVDGAVAIGRFFLLPNWLFLAIDMVQATWSGNSTSKVDAFARTLSATIEDKPGTYQSRLRQAGITDHEVEVQCKDVMFAGTDSSGTVLAKISWLLAKSPNVYETLRREVLKADAADTSYNVQSLQYLDAVVREGLRLARTNPVRFPRVVPPSGWTFSSSSGQQYHFPAGTVVGLAPMTLHSNPEIFVEPDGFRPERWLENPSAEMQRDLFPFNLGPRQCIARNLAYYELLITTRELARSDVLAGARAVEDNLEVIEWFNSRTVGDEIELVW